MDKLEKMKMEVQKMKINTTIAELELKIEERKADIDRMTEHIYLQNQQLQKLEENK